MYTATTSLPAGQVRRPPTAPILTQNETMAKEKLAGYVYEYLIHNGAPKAAEAFKSEVLANSPNAAKLPTPSEQGPGFLLNWWYVFWDLYCGAPERRDGSEGTPSVESKAFLDMVRWLSSVDARMKPLLSVHVRVLDISSPPTCVWTGNDEWNAWPPVLIR